MAIRPSRRGSALFGNGIGKYFFAIFAIPVKIPAKTRVFSDFARENALEKTKITDLLKTRLIGMRHLLSGGLNCNVR